MSRPEVSGFAEHLYSALSTSERMACLQRDAGGGSGTAADPTRAPVAIHRWKSQQRFGTEDHFEPLRQDGLAEQDLAVLGSAPELYARRLAESPAWVRDLFELYVTRPHHDGDSAVSRHVDEAGNGFLWLASPLFDEGLRRFRDRVRGLAARETQPFDPLTVESLFVPHLLRTLRDALDLVMVLELNVARVQGTLEGQTPQARFLDFCRRLREPEKQLSLAREYPVLFRQLHSRTMTWVESSVELLTRLWADWDDILGQFAENAAPGSLTSIRVGAGDTHRRGRSVAILAFASGFKLVYKPRSLSVDLHFDGLLQWVNEAGFATQFRTLKKIARPDYGWSEYATHQSCATREEVERFYQRLGGYLAAFYAIRATDMHHENLVASGEYPVPVDLETLFHPDARAEKEDPAIAAFQRSVMPVQLLPQRNSAAGDEDLDRSGFGARSGQRFAAGRTFSWHQPGTDEMRLARDVSGGVMVARNRPRIGDEEVVAAEYVESFLTGFEWVYRLIEGRRDELLSDGGLLDRFRDDEVRFVARPTAAYAALLRPCFQPDRLRNAVDRDQVFDGLWLGVAQQPSLTRLIPFEMRDLQGGDVPVFTSRPNSRDLWTSEGERIPEFFERTAMDVVREGLSCMGDEDLARQVLFIRTAIAAMGEGPRPPAMGRTTALASNRTEGRGALDLATAVGDMLCREALENESHASWLGITPGGPTGSTSLYPLDLGLYDGLSGCSLFLAYLSSITDDTSFRRIAEKSITLLRRHLDRWRSRGLPIQGLGAFTGLGGILYTLTHVGVLWEDASLIEEAKAIAADMPRLIGEDHALDVIGGSAGAIAALDVLNRVSPSDDLQQVALLCGARLVEQAQSQRIGVAWATNAKSTRPLTGFSHGAAGIAWSLHKLAAWTGQARYRQTAESAIAYERSTFVADEGNWPDFRAWPEDVHRPGCQTAWCHGAPGIGLARLDSLQHVDDRDTREEIRSAFATLVKSDVGANHGLCHGDLGNLDILLYAAQRGDDFWWAEYGSRLANQTLSAIADRGFICSRQTSVAPLGLMVGLAGIGYGLLRLASPQRVPSVLAMAPPPNV